MQKKLSSCPAHEPEPSSTPQAQAPERTLILGWNGRAETVITELDQYVTGGSSLTVVTDEPQAAAALEELRSSLDHQSVVHLAADTTDRRVLEALQPGGFDHIITLSSSDTLDVQQADGRTLVTLLHLRDMASRSGQNYSVVEAYRPDDSEETGESSGQSVGAPECFVRPGPPQCPYGTVFRGTRY